MAEKNQLSLCIITKNEEEFLTNCLNEMKEIADEVMVVDLGSDDHTLELAKQAGTKVYQPKWEDDFSKIKNFCMEHASGKWVLFMQADEMISPENLEQLNLLMKNPSAEGYLISVDYDLEERGISSPAQFLRLIRNRKEYRFCYRSFAYIPDETIYSLQNSYLCITHRRKRSVGWQLEEQIRLLKEDIQEHPHDSYVRYMEGIQLLNRRKYSESIVSFELAQQTINLGYLYAPHMYKCKGVSLISLERYQEAEEVLTESLKHFPFYNDLLVLRAEVYRQLGRNREATDDLKACLTLWERPNAFVPAPEIDTTKIQKMLEEIQTIPNQES